MLSSLLFTFRLLLTWGAIFWVVIVFWSTIAPPGHGDPHWVWVLIIGLVMGCLVISAASHKRRVRLIAGRLDGSTLSNRQRRQIEIPLPASEAFELVDAAIKELPRVEEVESTGDSLQVRAKVQRIDPYGKGLPGRILFGMFRTGRNQILATVMPGDGTGSVTLICEPEGGAWGDWFKMDDATNLENAEAIARAIRRRVTTLRQLEQEQARQSAAEKELTLARLSLLQAQVEPHFLYNTLTSAQYLTRSNPALADEMLGNLIVYLRRSLPSTDHAFAGLGNELERARAYLDILRIRMGDRLKLQIEVPNSLLALPLPSMMLQTLVENAIKHGLEPKPGGGTIWILARANGGQITLTVADDGQGFNAESSGTGIGLKNLRERLRLAYGNLASFTIVANFPQGVAATLTLPGSSLPTLALQEQQHA